MKKSLLTLVIVAIAITANAQSVSFSPSSMKLWGQLPAISKLTVEYKDFELVGLIPHRQYDFVMPTTGEYKGRSNDFNIGLFYRPVNLSKGDFSARGGAGIFFQQFPTPKGSIVNFSFELEYRINDTFSIEYQHLSNGFSIQNEFNPGLDNISIKINL